MCSSVLKLRIGLQVRVPNNNELKSATCIFAALQRRALWLGVFAAGALSFVAGCNTTSSQKTGAVVNAEHPVAMYNLGVQYWNKKDYALAIACWRKAADAGVSRAMFSIGAVYLGGDVLAKDTDQAMAWFRKAAEAGEVDAMYDIGSMYYGGEGVSTNYTEAMKWFRKAAGAGNSGAMYDIGAMYDNGQGVSRDEDQAREWMRRAADAGNPYAKGWLASRSSFGRTQTTPLSLGFAFGEGNSVVVVGHPPAGATGHVTGTVLEVDPTSQVILMEPDEGSTVVAFPSIRVQLEHPTTPAGRPLLRFRVADKPNVDWTVLKPGSQVAFDCRELSDHSIEVTDLKLAPAKAVTPQK